MKEERIDQSVIAFIFAKQCLDLILDISLPILSISRFCLSLLLQQEPQSIAEARRANATITTSCLSREPLQLKAADRSRPAFSG